MDRFTYPDQRSACELLLISDHDAQADAFVTRMRVGAGRSVYQPHFHMIALHLGAPVPVWHRRDGDEKVFHFHAEDSFVSPLDAPIESAHATPTEALYMYLNPVFLDGLAKQLGVSAQMTVLRPQLGAHDPVIARIGQELLREASAPGLGGRVYTDALITQLGVHLLRCSMPNKISTVPKLLSLPRQPRDLSRAREFIHAHLGTNITLSDIAAMEHLTPFHFSRLFKQQHGVSPHQYLVQARIEKAIELLRDPRRTVSDVALAVGFADHSHFIRHFKRLTGTTPRALQQERTQPSAKTC